VHLGDEVRVGRVFQVLVDSQPICPACKIWRIASRLMRAIPAAAGYSASLAKLRVLNARRQKGKALSLLTLLLRMD
jgi:hypothetical protein